MRALAGLVILILLQGLAAGQVPELLYLRFNEGSGTTTADFSLVGWPGVNPTSNSAGVWGPAKLGASSFNNAWPGSKAFWVNAPLQASGDWTLEVWIKSNDSSTSTTPLIQDPSAGGFVLSAGGNFIDQDDLELKGAFGSVVLDHARQQNVWVHVAVVNDTSEGIMTPYVNGVPGTPWIPTGPTDLSGTSNTSFLIAGIWLGQLDELRIWNRARTEAEILSTMNVELSASLVDLTVSAITSPVILPHSGEIPGAAETVSCEVMNVGTSVIPAGTTLAFSRSANGLPGPSEMTTLPSALGPGDVFAFSFAATADLSGTGPQTIEVQVAMAGDLNPTNDKRRREFGGDYGYLVNVLPWFEDFERAPAGWDPLWMSYWFQETEPSSNTAFPPSWGFSMSQLSTSPGGGKATGSTGSWQGPVYTAARSSTIDLRGVSNPRLKFYILSDVTSANPVSIGPSTFSIDIVQFPGGSIVQDVYGPVGDLGTSWLLEQIDLSAFSGQQIAIRLRIVPPTPMPGQTIYFGHGVRLDDFLLTDHPIGPGQPPQPGIAVFDLNGALNIGQNVPSFGEPGPYFTNATPGDGLVFLFEGAPNQPILLAYGPLNPVAATFPGIGQLDIGGPVDPMTGIPLGIQVLFDGNQPGGLNIFFNTDALGLSSFGFVLPGLPPGPLTTFQAVLRDPTSGLFAIGNAIELTVN